MCLIMILGRVFAPEVGVVEGPEDLMPNRSFSKLVSLYLLRWASIPVLSEFACPCPLDGLILVEHLSILGVSRSE